MPTVNFYSERPFDSKLTSMLANIRLFVAEKLTCSDIKLSPEEISVRLIQVDGGNMIGGTELEISAASFPERIKKQDEICLEVAKFLNEKAPYLGDVKVWLKLSELGHSWA